MSDTSNNAGSFLTGLADSFGSHFLKKKEQEHSEALDQESRQYSMLKDALQTATSRGDTNAAAHILRTMEGFSAESGGTKKRKANQKGILSHFADMLEKGRQVSETNITPEAQKATEQNQQLEQQQNQQPQMQGNPQTGIVEQSPNLLLGANRPRLATETKTVNKPLLMSNDELNQEDVKHKLLQQQALLPGEIQKTTEASRLVQERQSALESQRESGRRERANVATKALIERDVNKLAFALTDENTSPQEALEKAKGMIAERANIAAETAQKKLEHITTNEERLDKMTAARIQRMAVMNKQGAENLLLKSRGLDQRDRGLNQKDRRLSQIDQAATIKSQATKIHEQGINLRTELRNLRAGMTSAYNSMMNGMVSPADKVKAEEKFNQLSKEYENKSNEIMENNNKFDSIVPSSTETPLTSTSTTTSNSTQNGKGKLQVDKRVGRTVKNKEGKTGTVRAVNSDGTLQVDWH